MDGRDPDRKGTRAGARIGSGGPLQEGVGAQEGTPVLPPEAAQFSRRQCLLAPGGSAGKLGPTTLTHHQGKAQAFPPGSAARSWTTRARFLFLVAGVPRSAARRRIRRGPEAAAGSYLRLR